MRRKVCSVKKCLRLCKHFCTGLFQDGCAEETCSEFSQRHWDQRLDGCCCTSQSCAVLFFPWPNSALVIYFCTRSFGSVLSRQDFLLRRDILLPASQKTHQPLQAVLVAIRGLRLAGVSCCNAAEFVSELPLDKYLQSFYSLACRRSKRGIYQTGSWLSVSFPARRTAPLPRPSVLFSSNSHSRAFITEVTRQPG